MKDSVDELIPMVTILVNLSLQSANVPDSMKQALVTPLLKKDDLDPEVLKNYRPVSNLSFLSKVLEMLTNYMTINQLHEPMQSAYRACHSTETALVRVQNDILRTLDQGGGAILVLLDLSAAFDTIDHSILLSRMESVLGVKGSALQWFKSYLLGRKQRIKINGDFSENQEILWSVPQGSVLGALLFLIYIIPLAQLRARLVDYLFPMSRPTLFLGPTLKKKNFFFFTFRPTLSRGAFFSSENCILNE